MWKFSKEQHKEVDTYIDGFVSGLLWSIAIFLFSIAITA